MSVREQGREGGRAASRRRVKCGLPRVRALGVILAVCGLAGCEDEAPLGPTTQEFNQERQALAAKLEDGKGTAAKPARQASAPAPAAAPGFAADGGEFHYAAEGRRDPFRSYEWEYMKRELASAQQTGPLEQYDLAQLELVGVVWDVGRARALVQDPSGMSYVVGAGARMGKNEGLVTRIDDNLVVVRERYVDLYGNESTKDVEMRIRASDGG
jgi:Tfp pilus assembly protein PilP